MKTKRRPVTSEQLKSRLPDKVVLTGALFAACLRKGELYLKIQMLRQCRLYYPLSTPSERETAFVHACQQKLIEPKKGIGLNRSTVAYGLKEQEQKSEEVEQKS